jgi:Na+/proline symporter
MKPLDWAVMFGWIAFIVCYGLWRGRRSGTVSEYMLAGKTMPWYAMGLSIMATQASAITFISTTGQAYVDGMRFVQFYFGLPVAMVILSATAVPIFHRAKVYTAYEYLEKRFDAKTRALVSGIFLIQRGLAAGLALYAPSVVLSVILGWSDRSTTIVMGTLIVLFTATGGIKAVTWVDVQQMAMIFASLLLAFGIAVYLLPPDVSFGDALTLAGALGRLRAVDTHFDPDNRYNLWSGLIGGSFLALAYFGCDQSQVQRYLTGKSIAQSRLSLIFNAMAKVPMQFFILFIGAIVFVAYLFLKPPVVFHPVEMQHLEANAGFAPVAKAYNTAFDKRRDAARKIVDARHAGTAFTTDDLRAAQKEFEAAKQQGNKLVEQTRGSAFNDTNYIFLNFVTTYLPVGVVGLIVAVIFSAAMSSTSGEINSLASVTVIDIYKRHVNATATDRHYVWASRAATVFWGIYAVVFANFGGGFGALIEAVNMIGSLFYGGLLGVFVLAFFFPRVTANGAFFGVLAGEAAIFAANRFTSVSFLWYNVIGALVVVATAQLFPKRETKWLAS